MMCSLIPITCIILKYQLIYKEPNKKITTDRSPPFKNIKMKKDFEWSVKNTDYAMENKKIKEEEQTLEEVPKEVIKRASVANKSNLPSISNLDKGLNHQIVFKQNELIIKVSSLAQNISMCLQQC